MTKPEPSHTPVADLNLSGVMLQIGITDDSDGSIYMHANGLDEPTYMSIPEAQMVIAALNAAISREREEK